MTTAAARSPEEVYLRLAPGVLLCRLAIRYRQRHRQSAPLLPLPFPSVLLPISFQLTADRWSRSSLPNCRESTRQRLGARASGIEREFAEREALETALAAKAARWREEVASRVEGYRSRRSKKNLAGNSR